MDQRLLVLGAGYTGREMIRQAVARGYDVIGTTRSAERVELLESLGATGLQWDIVEDDPAIIHDHIGPNTTVVYSIPTIYKTYEAAPDWKRTHELPRHIAPLERVLRSCARRRVRRFIYLSSTSVYGDHNAAWIDEHAVRRPTSPYGMMRRDIENYIASYAMQFPVNIARPAGIYGPDRTLIDYIRNGNYRLINPNKITNRIHLEDLANIILTIAERAPDQGAWIYNCADGNPQTVGALVDFLVRELGIEPPPAESLEAYEERVGVNAASRWRSSMRVRNRRLKNELGVTLKYPDVFTGYRVLIAEHYLTPEVPH